jgi:hypothetical protein
MDRVVLRRDAHHLRAAPGDRAHVGVLKPVLGEDQALGRIDLGDRIRNLEIEQLGRAPQPLGMLGALEDLAAIGALALEHAGAVMKPVREHMDLGVPPRHEGAVVPDPTVALVEGDDGHAALLVASSYVVAGARETLVPRGGERRSFLTRRRVDE